MPHNGGDFRRKCQFPLLLGSGMLPLPAMLLIGFTPEKTWLAAVFTIAYAVMVEACLLVRGKARLWAGLAGCAALAVALAVMVMGG